jgi:hypothetical protein
MPSPGARSTRLVANDLQEIVLERPHASVVCWGRRARRRFSISFRQAQQYRLFAAITVPQPVRQYETTARSKDAG